MMDNALKNTELLQKYMAASQSMGAFDNGRADFQEAQAYYRQAADALISFYTIKESDNARKNAILYTGAFIALKAADAFEYVIARYRERFYKSVKGKEFMIPCVDKDVFCSYADFARSIRELSPQTDLWLKQFTSGYKHASEERARKDVESLKSMPITEVGLKICHLKGLIEYCDILIKAINVLACDDESEKRNAEKANLYFEKGIAELSDLAFAYEDMLEVDPDALSMEKLREVCRRQKNMSTSFMRALLSMEIPNEVMDDVAPSELAAEVIKRKKFESAQMICACEDYLRCMFSIDDHGEASDFPAPSKIMAWTYCALKIGNVMMADFLNAIAMRT